MPGRPLLRQCHSKQRPPSRTAAAAGVSNTPHLSRMWAVSRSTSSSTSGISPWALHSGGGKADPVALKLLCGAATFGVLPEQQHSAWVGQQRSNKIGGEAHGPSSLYAAKNSL